MYQLIYASAAAVAFSARDLRRLLAEARHTNDALGITGMLVYQDGSFLQVLEGSRDSVQALYDKIDADERHCDTRVLLRSEVSERKFGDWKMGFYDASARNGPSDVSSSAAGASGYIDFFGASQSLAGEGGRAKKALLQFRYGSWRQRVQIKG